MFIPDKCSVIEGGKTMLREYPLFHLLMLIHDICYQFRFQKFAKQSFRVSNLNFKFEVCDNSVGIALGYGLDGRGSGVRFSAGAGNFPLHHRVQNGSAPDPASYPLDTRGSFPGVKRSGREAGHSPSSSAELKGCMELHGLVLS
jgi:hypothetical protein